VQLEIPDRIPRLRPHETIDWAGIEAKACEIPLSRENPGILRDGTWRGRRGENYEAQNAQERTSSSRKQASIIRLDHHKRILPNLSPTLLKFSTYGNLITQPNLWRSAPTAGGILLH
jgi:hypothetical protein